MEEKKKGQRGRFCDSGDNSLCAAAMSGYKGHQCQRRQKTRGASVHALARWHGRTRALPSGEDGVWEVEGMGWAGMGWGGAQEPESVDEELQCAGGAHKINKATSKTNKQ